MNNKKPEVKSEAQRRTQRAIWFGGAALAAFVWVNLFGEPRNPATIALVGAGGLSVLPALWYAPRALWAHLRGGTEREALAATEGLAWRHFYKGTGIAVDTQQRRLHLLNGKVYRSYPFAQVRTWERRQQSGGGVYGGGLAGVAANLDTMARNAANSGLFIEVRDVDHPAWRIAFSPKQLHSELPRWMEMLQQALNEGTQAQAA